MFRRTVLAYWRGCNSILSLGATDMLYGVPWACRLHASQEIVEMILRIVLLLSS